MATSDQLCPECGYDRSGLVGKPCPECGSERATVVPAMWAPSRRLVVLVVAVIIALGLAAFIPVIEIEFDYGRAYPKSAQVALSPDRYKGVVFDLPMDKDVFVHVVGMWVTEDGVYLDFAGADVDGPHTYGYAHDLWAIGPKLITIVDERGVEHTVERQVPRRKFRLAFSGSRGWVAKPYTDVRTCSNSDGSKLVVASVPFFTEKELAPGTYTIRFDSELWLHGIAPGAAFDVEAKPIPNERGR